MNAIRYRSGALALKPALRQYGAMISLVKFLVFISVVAALIFTGVFALATFVSPKSRDMGFTVPPSQMIQQTK